MINDGGTYTRQEVLVKLHNPQFEEDFPHSESIQMKARLSFSNVLLNTVNSQDL